LGIRERRVEGLLPITKAAVPVRRPFARAHFAVAVVAANRDNVNKFTHAASDRLNDGDLVAVPHSLRQGNSRAAKPPARRAGPTCVAASLAAANRREGPR